VKATNKRGTFSSRISIMLIAVLCVGLLCPGFTASASAATVAGQATLTIVFGLGAGDVPDVVVNKAYPFEAGDTVEDLLNRAVAEGDIEAYALNMFGFIQSVTKTGGITFEAAADFSTYWATYVSGAYYGGADTLQTLPLEDGKAYQFCWESWPPVYVPDWDQIGMPTGGGNTGGEVPTNPPAGYSQEVFSKLFTNISARFEGTGEDWEALSMAAIGKGALVNTDAIIANAVEAYGDPDTTNLQRSILALTALGIDATNVTQGTDTYNMIEKLATTPIAHDTTNGLMFALLAYTSGPYTPPPAAIADVQALIDGILALQNADGGWSFIPGASDADMTAMGIATLSPYRADDPRVEGALQEALVALKALQLPGGGFASVDVAGVLNTNSTAMVVVALSAAGIDAQTWGTADNPAATPLNALLSQANAAVNGFLFGAVNNSMATEQGFRALVAYQGLKNTSAAYNIYIDASSGVADLDEVDSGGNNTNNGSQNNGGEGGPSDEAAQLSPTTPATSDSLQLAAAAILALAMGVLLLTSSRFVSGKTRETRVNG